MTHGAGWRHYCRISTGVKAETSGISKPGQNCLRAHQPFNKVHHVVFVACDKERGVELGITSPFTERGGPGGGVEGFEPG